MVFVRSIIQFFSQSRSASPLIFKGRGPDHSAEPAGCAVKLFMGAESSQAAGLVMRPHAYLAARRRLGPGSLCGHHTGTDHIGG